MLTPDGIYGAGDSLDRIPRKLLWRSLNICDSRGAQLIKLLKKCCPDEFRHKRNQRGLTAHQCRMLKALHCLYQRGLITEEIEPMLLEEGLEIGTEITNDTE